MEIGLRHSRIGGFLQDRQYTVSSVESEPTPDGHAGARVVVLLARAVALTEWPEEVVCLIDRGSDDITGVVWLVDLEEEQVIALSPQWDGSVSCV